MHHDCADGWMTWHSERNLRRVRWSTRRSRRRCSWCGTKEDKLAVCFQVSGHCNHTEYRQTGCFFLLLQDMTYTSRKPAKPRIWGWMCPMQERSQCVEPWPRDGPRREDEREGVRGLASGLRSKPVRAYGERELGRRKRMEQSRWERRQPGLSKRGRGLLKLHNAEVEAGV